MTPKHVGIESLEEARHLAAAEDALEGLSRPTDIRDLVRAKVGW